MIETLSLSTITLARLLGVFIVVMAFAVLRSPLRFTRIREDMEALPALLFIIGIVTLVMGLLLVSFHNHWTDPLAILVSACGWIILFKGMAALAAPELLLKIGARFGGGPRVRLAAIIAICVGLALLALSFITRASLTM